MPQALTLTSLIKAFLVSCHKTFDTFLFLAAPHTLAKTPNLPHSWLVLSLIGSKSDGDHVGQICDITM